MDVDFTKLQKEIELGGEKRKEEKVKDRRPANIQITAEQIIQVAHKHQERYLFKPQVKITDKEELEEYLLLKRTDYEKAVAKNRHNIAKWVQYALWEESQHFYERGRSIFERALAVDYQNPSTWIKYAEMEMRNKFVNHARNVFDRATSLLPRENNIWFKYVYMEEMLGEVVKTRKIFERWIKWLPDINVFKAYVKFEVRHKELDNGRSILEKMIKLYPTADCWLYYTKFEVRNGTISKARKVFERGIENIGNNDEKLFIHFARFEQKNKEYDRARVIYKYALDNVPKKYVKELYKNFLVFEKQYGEKGEIEKVILSKKRFHYEEEIKKNPMNYDVWFDYIHLEEKNDNLERIREVYERAIAQLPPVEEKKYWKRYVYFWIKYAIFEEVKAKDVEKTREIYQQLIMIIPHKKFSFSKAWILNAKFETRQKNMDKVRKIFGRAIGIAPKEKIFQEYIKTEIMLGNVERTRKIYQRFLEHDSSNSETWIQYSELEKKLEEIDRARGILELGVNQEPLDMPEKLWKHFIDFEIEMDNKENVRGLYSRLLKRTKHVKVWISYCEFEISIKDIVRAREIFKTADQYLREGFYSEDAEEKTEIDRKEQRVALLTKWKQFEETFGNKELVDEVEKKMPKRVKRKRRIISEDGTTIAGFEEFYDYVFKDDEEKLETSKLFEMAEKWKEKQGENVENK